MTLPATDGFWDKVLALLTYDASSPLIFSSGLFLFLFAGFLLVYSAFRRAPMARIVYVIAFSLYFYYKSSGIYFLLLVFAAASDFLIARGIFRTRSKSLKRWLMVLSVAVNLGMLGYFKYTNFFIDISNQLFGQGFLQFRNIFLPVVSLAAFFFVKRLMHLHMGRLAIPAAIYCFFLSLMLSKSTQYMALCPGLASGWIGFGGIAFFISDFTIIFLYFYKFRKPENRGKIHYLNLATYYYGILAFDISILYFAAF